MPLSNELFFVTALGVVGEALSTWWVRWEEIDEHLKIRAYKITINTTSINCLYGYLYYSACFSRTSGYNPRRVPRSSHHTPSPPKALLPAVCACAAFRGWLLTWDWWWWCAATYRFETFSRYYRAAGDSGARQNFVLRKHSRQTNNTPEQSIIQSIIMIYYYTCISLILL